jgi:hypothetical protein
MAASGVSRRHRPASVDSVAPLGRGTENWLAVRQGVSAALREHRDFVVLAVTVTALLVLAIVILPPLLAGGDDTENDVRSTLLQGLAGLFLAGGLYFTAQTLRLNRESAERTSAMAERTSAMAERTYLLEREGQITERFTRAIDQLGDEKMDVRLGGIYALERIAKSSAEDHGPIMEVLTAYVREHAPWPPRPADKGEEAVSDEHRELDEDGVPAPATDVQAVIAVLGRRVLGRKGEHDLDLRLVDLRRAKFGKGADEGHFEKANFAGPSSNEQTSTSRISLRRTWSTLTSRRRPSRRRTSRRRTSRRRTSQRRSSRGRTSRRRTSRGRP